MKLSIGIVRFAFLIFFMILLSGCFNRVYQKKILPTERIETIPNRPSPEYAWVKGHLKYSRSGYQWVSGNYHKIPPGKKSWVEGRYVKRLGRYKYAHSYWD